MGFKLMLPALCDLIGSWLLFAGAIWVNASVVEMSSCTNTIFTPILSVCFLKKKIARHEYIGIALSVLGVVTVGISQVLSASEKSTDARAEESGEQSWFSTIFGLCLIFGANFWYAAEFIVAEKLLGDNEHLSAFMSVGVMGIWGSIMMLPVFVLTRSTPATPAEYAPLWHEDVIISITAPPRSQVFVFIVSSASTDVFQ